MTEKQMTMERKEENVTPVDYGSNTPEKLYSLKFHEEFNHGDGFKIKRVPGGWIYIYHRLDQGQMNSVFVPFNNEYQNPLTP